MPVRPKSDQFAQVMPGATAGRPLSQRAVAIAAVLSDQSESETNTSLAEVERLAATLGIEVVARVVQRRSAITGSYLGQGKLRDVAELVRAGTDGQLPAVIVDGEITPSQLRALELALGTRVLDRTALILNIFEARARTPRARLEVEIARLTYELPRVRDDAAIRDKQGGGAGRGERGHTAVELAKQQKRERLARLRRELSALQETAEQQRRERGPMQAARVALVGYTNAGKSSLMRALTGSAVWVEDKLFATLGLTTRTLSPPASPEVIVTDTVGFIQRLPHELVASFRSTLDEACDADRLLLVVDASDPAWRAQLRVTEETLDAIGARAERRIVLNKIDRVAPAEREQLACELPGALQLCAHTPEDAAALRAAILASLDGDLREALLHIPYAKGSLAAEVRSRGRIVEERYDELGSLLRVRAHPESLARWQAALGV